MSVKPLLFGIDKLEGSYEVDNYTGRGADLVRRLLTLKVAAQQERKPQPYQIGSRHFLVQPKGRPFYELSLRHADFILWLTDYEKRGTPPVLVSFSSEYLWAVGPLRALEEVDRTLTLAGISPSSNKCSRVDLMVDFTGRPIVFRDLYDIVCSSRKRLPLDGNFLTPDEYLGRVGQKVRESGVHVEDGLEIRSYAIQKGRRTELTGLVVALGQPLSWRGYNKILEIERVSGKRWFFDIWRDNGWEADPETGEMPAVFRSEFQLRREVIADLAPILGRPLDSMEDVIRETPAIWRYLTGEWLQFKDRRRDKNVTRCPVRSWWTSIQQPEIGVDWQDIDPVERLGRLRKAKRKILDDMIAGCLAGVAAHQGTAGDLTQTVDAWVDGLGSTLAPDGDLQQLCQDWGLKARKRAMNYLLADLRDRLKEALQAPDIRLPDLAEVIRRWQGQLPDEVDAEFKERSMIKKGFLNHGEDANDAQGRRDWPTHSRSAAPVHSFW